MLVIDDTSDDDDDADSVLTDEDADASGVIGHLAKKRRCASV